MLQRLHIEVIDEVINRGYRTVYVLCTTVSVQQMNLLPENASQNEQIFAQKSIYAYIGPPCSA